MKFLIRFSLLGVLTALLSSGLVYAEPGDKRIRRQAQSQQERQENAARKPQADEDARYEREERGARNERGARRHKLSREERHQLRRDIDEAGRDIYRERRERR